MKRLAIAVAGVALAVGLTACARTVERLVVVTATPSAPSPTPEPNLSDQEAIGLVWERRTSAACPESPDANIWKDRAFCECMSLLERAEKAGPFQGEELPEGLRRVSLPE